MKIDMSTYEPFGLEAIETASRDEIAARNAILEVLAVPDRSGLAEACRARAACFTWEATARQTLAVYRRLLRK